MCVADAIIRQNQETIGIVFWMHPNSFDIFWTTIGQNRVPRTYQQEYEVTIQAFVTLIIHSGLMFSLGKCPKSSKK